MAILPSVRDTRLARWKKILAALRGDTCVLDQCNTLTLRQTLVAILTELNRGSTKYICVDGICVPSMTGTTLAVCQETCGVITDFTNAEMTLFKYCSGGPNVGPPANVLVNAGVFSSSSQADADAQARYAAELVLVNLSEGPCCVGAGTRVQDFDWQTSGGGSPSNDNSVISIVGNPTGSASGFATQNPMGGFGSNETSIVWSVEFCSSWAQYDLILSFDFVVTNVPGGAPGTDECHIDVFYDSVNISHEGFITPTSGHRDITIPVMPTGPHSFILEFVAAKITGDSVGSPTITVSNLILRPLVPPVVIQDPVIVSSIPVPFHYADRPANDDFSSAHTIAGASGTVSGGTNIYASIEEGEPQVAGAQSSVWYNWVAPSNGSITFDTFGSDFDTALGIYTGSAVNALTLIGSNDDTGGSQSEVNFTAVSGTTYRIQVSGFDEGNVVLNWGP